ncbi:acyl-CoA dehydrogenase family protein [Caulobacter segnis]|uniref:acyl-CoA dehydrogenase family protein n=1 Tax=Caulobacter segnis TaxID=88688 RepID=UPI00285DFF29|nr:acyl-CoA dehydrogenase family protein [Caulobacter segnis]MDR6623893.1 acyl-CoA dehydrogenase [Caulobacter segnis]
MTDQDEHDAAEAAFLAEVRAFLDENLTEDLRAAGRRTIGLFSDIQAGRTWQKRLQTQGWAAPSWPKAHGGAGWSPRQRFLFDRECVLNDAPALFAAGARSLGPLLIEEGSAAHRARYLPAILAGDDLWCQGFSEPDAGSDLAAIRSRADRVGDHYRLRGCKIWTTGAHLANRMFALMRTGPEGGGREGLTFLLIDMDSPGVSVAPVLDLSGEHEFNQVFFDDVPVPIGHRVGAEGQGWRVAKRLMQLARSNNTPAASVRRALQQIRALATGPEFAQRLAALAIDLEAFEQLELRLLPGGQPRPGDDLAPSLLKLVGSELRQNIAALGLEAAVPFGAIRHGSSAPGSSSDLVATGAEATARYLASRANTIYSGTSEIQRNLIARGLGAS